MESNANKLKLYLGLGFLGLVFIAGAAVMFVRAYRATVAKNHPPETVASLDETKPPEPRTIVSCTLIVNYGEGKAFEYQVPRAENTALDCLLRASAAHGFEVETQRTEIGAAVKRIGKEASESASSPWRFSVNGKVGETQPDRTDIADGDVVEWKQ